MPRMPLFPARLCLLAMFSALVCADAALARIAARDEPVTLQQAWNPKPDALDIELPMPCGLKMAFRAVAVPGEPGQEFPFMMGLVNVDKGRRIYGERREGRIAGVFTANDLPDEWLALLGESEWQRHTVYLMGKYEVSQAQWDAVMNDTCPMTEPSKRGMWDRLRGKKKDEPAVGANLPATAALPVREISWTEMQNFLGKYNQWLQKQPHALPRFVDNPKETGSVRLPTEAEWEFAARGGMAVSKEERESDFFLQGRKLGDYAVFSAEQPEPIGSRLPNALGLYDTAGNVKELMGDDFRVGGSVGDVVAKGGGFRSGKDGVLPGWRDEAKRYNSPNDQGFRLALTGPLTASARRMAALNEEGIEKRAAMSEQLQAEREQRLAAEEDARKIRRELERMRQAVGEGAGRKTGEVDYRTGFAFVIDTTSAMRPYIEQTRELIASLYDELEKSSYGEMMAFAVVAFRGGGTPGIGYTTKTICDFTTVKDRKKMEDALAQMDAATVASRTDDHDSLAGIMEAVDTLSWADYGSRVMLLITDAGPFGEDDPASATGLSPEMLADYLHTNKIYLTALHMKTPSGAHNHKYAAEAYRILTRQGDYHSYIAIDASTPAAGAASLRNVGRQLGESYGHILTASAEGRLIEAPKQTIAEQPILDVGQMLPKEAEETRSTEDQRQKPIPEEEELDDAESLFKMGEKYRLGQGVTQDGEQAAEYYRKAAKQGHALAQSQLAVLYFRGQSVPKDGQSAKEWGGAAAVSLESIAIRGDALACFHLGRLYQLGLGVEQNDGQAVTWYRHAADRGFAEAQNNLGMMYKHGRGGLPQDDAQAASWFRKAAEQGHTWGQFNYGAMCAEGKGVERNVQEAAKWYGKAAEKGYVWAQYNLALMYSNGRGVPQDDEQAAFWLRKAADQGHAWAQYNLGVRYANGRGIAKDDEQAVWWYRKAAAQGNTGAQNNLGIMYKDGRGVPQDDAQAVFWYRKAAEQGYEVAQYNLGRMYANGRGVLQDDKQAVYWYRKAAEKGHDGAQNALRRLGQ